MPYKDKERKRLYDKEYSRRYPYSREKLRKRSWLRRRTHFRDRLLTQTKARAKQLGIPFALKVEDVTWPTHCPILGVELIYSPSPPEGRNRVATLDKLVPQLGYVAGNVFVVSSRANRLKDDGTLEEHRAIVRYIEARQKGEAPCLSSPTLTP